MRCTNFYLLALLPFALFQCKDAKISQDGGIIRIIVDHSDSLDAHQVQNVINEVIPHLYKSTDSTAHTKVALSQVRESDPPFVADSLTQEILLRQWQKACPRPWTWKFLMEWPCPSETEREIMEEDSLRSRRNITKSLDSLLTSGATERSYILRSLSLPLPEPCTKNCQLWIISDMLEYSNGWNFYQCIPAWEEAHQRIRDQWGLPKNLHGTQVVIFLLKRCPAEGGEMQRSREFRELWNEYFQEVTGKSPKWVEIPIGKECGFEENPGT